MDAVRVAPLGTLLIVNAPLAFAAAPLFVPSTTTFAPASADPVAASVTVPDTVICAERNDVRENMRRLAKIRLEQFM
jgi:hypothetical protein